MKKELKDFIHLYLGCESKVLINYGLHEKTVSAILLGYNIRENNCSVKCKDIYGNEWDDFRIVPISDIKPILRPLSSMTIQEAAEYADFYHNSPIPDECTIEVKQKEKWVHVSITSPDGSSGISLFPGGPHGDKAEAFRYLLSKHFDLFDLIPSGIAIDSTTLTTNNS